MLYRLNILDPTGRRVWAQNRPLPSVYLDHWAFRNISEDPALADRFRRAILARNGTLSISVANIVEFSQVADRRQIDLAEQFIDSLLPHVFFQNTNFLEVADIEKKRKQGLKSNGSPDSDVPIMSMFTQNARDFDTLPSARAGLHSIAQNASQYKMILEMGADLFKSRAEKEWFPQIERAGVAGMTNTLKSASRESVTEPVFIALCEYLHRRKSPIKKNDVMDYVHMLVPVTHNQYVLLDGNTRQAADAVLSRLKKAYSEMDPRLGEMLVNSFAAVYSKSDLEQFFRELETGEDIKKTEAARATAAAAKGETAPTR